MVVSLTQNTMGRAVIINTAGSTRQAQHQKPTKQSYPNVQNAGIYIDRVTVAGLCAGLLLLGGTHPAQAAVTPHSQPVLMDTSNTAVMQSLRQLKRTKDRFSSQDPPAALSSRFTGALQQLQRIELLVKIDQYDNARMALRQGSFQSLRMDLGYGQEMYRVVTPQVREARTCLSSSRRSKGLGPRAPVSAVGVFRVQQHSAAVFK
eukprot:GHRQ01025493.1.p1 GENE.GHRQ01025493.1~~GHRQ01025493.1.p1  ORF type:complete len:205 (+),score=40.82 GHRQ01025493.1:554-1168(+)